MQKKFLSNLILLLTLNFLVKPFYLLGVEAEIQNRVGAAVFGDYFALISFSFLLNILLDLGISNYNTRSVARDQEVVSLRFNDLFSLRIVLVFLYLLFIIIVGFLLQYSMDQMKILMILAANQCLVAFILFMRSNLSGLHLFKQDSLISILDKFLMILIFGAMLWTPIMGGEPFKIEWFVYGQTAAYGITFLISFALVMRKTGSLKLHINKERTKELLRKSLPYALLIFLMFLAFRIDSVMLERMLKVDGKEQAGIYAMGFRYFEAANMIAYLFAVLLFPIFARMLKERVDVSNLVQLSSKLLFSGSLVLVVLCFVYAKELLDLRYIANTVEAAPIFSLLMINFLAICITYVFGTLLTANGSLKILNWIAFGGFVMNVSLNILWIPLYGAWGCALASLITQMAMSIVQIFFAFREIQISFRWKLSLRFILFAAGCLFFFLAYHNILG